MRVSFKTTCVAVLGLTASLAWAETPRQTGTLLLTLAEGVSQAAPDNRYTRDMELELTLRDGKFDPKVWGYAVTVQKCDHEGGIVKTDGDNLTVKMTLNRDAFGLKNDKSPIGTAEYQITFKRDGENYTGSFTGTIRTGGGSPAPAASGATAPAAGESEKNPLLNNAGLMKAIYAAAGKSIARTDWRATRVSASCGLTTRATC